MKRIRIRNTNLTRWYTPYPYLFIHLTRLLLRIEKYGSTSVEIWLLYEILNMQREVNAISLSLSLFPSFASGNIGIWKQNLSCSELFSMKYWTRSGGNAISLSLSEALWIFNARKMYPSRNQNMNNLVFVFSWLLYILFLRNVLCTVFILFRFSFSFSVDIWSCRYIE